MYLTLTNNVLKKKQTKKTQEFMYLIFNAYHYFYYFIQYVVCNKAECWLRMVCNTDIDFTLTLKRHSYIP